MKEPDVEEAKGWAPGAGVGSVIYGTVRPRSPGPSIGSETIMPRVRRLVLGMQKKSRSLILSLGRC